MYDCAVERYELVPLAAGAVVVLVVAPPKYRHQLSSVSFQNRLKDLGYSASVEVELHQSHNSQVQGALF